MKNIKRKIFQIILTVFMVFSSCFLTSTVEAVDDTGNAARSSGYFTNENIYVSDNKIAGNGSFKGEKPDFIASKIPTGSDLSEGATEGMVWTNKKIEIIDRNTGIYKITFQALGFKYRNVDKDNVKEDDVWKNPLAAGSTLTISEEIAKNFHVIENDNAHPTKLTDGYEKYFKEDADIGIKSEGGKVTLSFNANGVKLDNYESEDNFWYDKYNNEDDGIAFDVEGSFYVQIDSNVGAGTYPTGNADSSFEPAEDNFYYYKWGFTESEYQIDGLKWENSSDHWARIQNPNKSSGTIYFPDINGNQGSFTIPDNWYSKQGTSGTFYDHDNQLREGEYNIATTGFNGKGINSIQVYVSGKKHSDSIYMQIVILYATDPESKLVFEPEKPLPSSGGNDGLPIDLGIVVSKDAPTLRPDKDPDGDGIIDEVFNNHGEITLALPSIEDVETKKTASLINWDERTYRIDLYASSTLEQQAEPVDIMFALDFSGSMPWLLNEPSGTISFNDLDTLENRRKYTVDNDKEKGTVNFWSRFKYFVFDTSDNEYKPIAYFDFEGRENDGWYAIKSKGRNNKDDKTAGTVIYNDELKVNSRKTIYVKGENDYTKLEQLLLQTQSFINSLASASPNSKVGFTTYAGYEISTTTDLYNVTSLKDSGVSNMIGSSALEGNTSQGVGIQNAQAVLENKGSNNNQFIILFTDGTEAKKSDVIFASDAAYNVKHNTNIKIYTIGLANPTVLGNMKPHLTSWSSGEGYYYAASDYTAFENAFNSIFDDLVGSIKNVEIVDVIDERFTITEGEIHRLNQIPGVTATQNTIRWDISELKYSTEVEDGSHLWINIVAKDDFLGGNYIPTNVASESIVKVGNTSEQLADKPVVNVKPQLKLNNGEKTYFLGEEIDPIEYIDTLLDQSNISLTDSQKKRLITDDEISIDYSYKNTADKLGTLTFKYEPITTHEKVSNLETHNASKVGKGVEEYKLTVTYDVSIITERQNIIDNSYGYTDTSFENNHTNCSHTTNSELIDKPHVAEDVTVSDLYIVNVVDGSIKINKTINDKVADPGTQGDTIVTFLIEGETVSGQNVHRYEVIRFNSIGTKSFTIDGLEKGVYTITELDSIRYDIDTINVNETTNVPKVVDKDNKKITFYIGYANEPNGKTNLNATHGEATYTNKLINDESIGDTDVVTNSFEVCDDGSVIIKKDNYKVSQD